MLADRKAPEVPEIFLEAEAMSLSEERSQVRQFLATRYSAGLKESLGEAPEELTSMEVLSCDLDVGTDWDLAVLMEVQTYVVMPAFVAAMSFLARLARSLLSPFLRSLPTYYHWPLVMRRR